MSLGLKDLDWSFGLINSSGKYLTAEAFGARINCCASSMKKKQIWFLEQDKTGRADDGGGTAVYFRSHLGKYLTVDGDGKFLGNGESKGDEQAFIIEAQSDGRWALKSWKYNWYAGGSGENLTAFTQEVAEDRLWTVDLAMHPQVCLRNIKRQRYVHLSGEQLTTDEDIPWGDDAVLEISFNRSSHSYSIRDCNGLFLSGSGILKSDPELDTEFTIEFSGGVVSFKNKSSSKYLTALGATGLCKATKSSISKDEQFQFENSYPQVQLRASNGKSLSIKQGVEVAAMQGGEITDNEVFQLEPLGNSRWFVKANTDKLWDLVDGSIHARGTPPGPDETVEPDGSNTFAVEFDGPNVRFKASNGNYVSQQMNKYLKANKSEPDESCNFTFTLVNRPRLILRGEFGFVGTMESGLLECNKSIPEAYNFTVADGNVSISNHDGKYWKVTETGVSAISASPEIYHIQLFEFSKMAILTPDGMLLQSEQHGALVAKGTSIDNSTLFEY